ncbi:hypothetical protein [uncultured Muriicola sp.]|uniref:hypothetical protein n=1 Tax=uncultured Muriicola sp. TaxID=1583102 RepID=UPI002631D643|nr:hypothetical protein [uncultured Muriicola sp.]
MARSISVIFFMLFLCSCKKDDINPNNALEGTWRLIEMYADPGDGSGDFRPVNSQKNITFKADGTYSSNGNVCDFSTMANEDTQGNYLALDVGYQIVCESEFSTELRLEIREGYLIVSFFCIEPCQQKFQRI